MLDVGDAAGVEVSLGQGLAVAVAGKTSLANSSRTERSERLRCRPRAAWVIFLGVGAADAGFSALVALRRGGGAPYARNFQTSERSRLSPP